VEESPRQRALAYLRDHNVMTLATFGDRGLWAAAVFYASDGFELYFLSAAGTRHGVNMGAGSDVSATVQEDYREWRDIKGVQLEGSAARLEGAEKDAAIACYERKFPFVRAWSSEPLALIAALKRVSWYRVVPSRLYLIDNSLGFGHRDQVVP
jgi:uncharacterized protein YhbP (UPF0306 family)